MSGSKAGAGPRGSSAPRSLSDLDALPLCKFRHCLQEAFCSQTSPPHYSLDPEREALYPMASIEKWVWDPSEPHGPSGASDSEWLLELSRGLRYLVPEVCGGPWKWLSTLDKNGPQQCWGGR